MDYASEVFVVGGKGFVGSAFVRYCESVGRSCAVLDLDTYASFVGRRCRILVNANGNSRKPLASQQPLADFDASVRSVRSTLVDFQFDKYVHLSSCDVYPDCSSPQTTRESLAPDPALQSPYGFHKYLAEQCIRHAVPDWLIFRFGGFIGPGLRKNAIFDILQGGPLFLDPASELQFLHTDRAAEIVLQLADRGVTREVFNLCGQGVVRLSEVASKASQPIAVKPGSPRVRYEIGLEKISAYVTLPETRAAVLDFVQERLRSS